MINTKSVLFVTDQGRRRSVYSVNPTLPFVLKRCRSSGHLD
ncbi:hypothetical protein SynTAK9802_02657 [Synechococcus sp. TAK9802]|nr:hypothetical protein SynTAK9802_02657 [Synechococcus sp. TAK9802]